MIHAVLNGKASHQDIGEDILTSTVFGVLKHLPVSEVWLPILASAQDMRTQPVTLLSELFESEARRLGGNLEDYKRASISFWPQHSKHGEPDLLVVFSGLDPSLPPAPLACLVEVKLWSSKGAKKGDQLQRYWRALNDKAFLKEALVREASPLGLVYLTALASSEEVDESAKDCTVEPLFRCFQLSWQDLLDSLDRSLPQLEGREPLASMIEELQMFLRAMRLGRFAGFSEIALPEIAGAWAYAASLDNREHQSKADSQSPRKTQTAKKKTGISFSGFHKSSELSAIQIQQFYISKVFRSLKKGPRQ